MKSITILIILVLSINLTGFVAAQTAPVKIILDTDMDSDVDDVGALAMLHHYERAGKARILGIVVTSDELYSATCTSAINTYFGRPDIPIGVSQRDSLKTFSKYTKKVSDTFPHPLRSHADAETGTQLYRRLLVSEPDKSVVILTIGHLTSLRALLESRPDDISPLTGKELVARKVRAWSCMGGQYPRGKEANFYRPDPASTVYCLSEWQLPVTFAGWELGAAVVTGGLSYKLRANPGSPVYKAYEYYNGFRGRASWDQISVLEAVEGLSPFFHRETGFCRVAIDGSNEWSASRPHNGIDHGYLQPLVPAEKIGEHIDRLMLEN